MNSEGRRVIVWDVDDVLNTLMREWFLEFRQQRNECSVDYDGLTMNPPHELIGIASTEYLRSLDSFRSRRYASLPPHPGVLDWFREHGRRAEHIALTAIPRAYAHLSAAWVTTHFGDWIRTFGFVPSPRSGSAEEIMTKRDYLHWLGGGDILVDDRQENVQGLPGTIEPVLVPQPWNRSTYGTVAEALSRVRTLL